MKRQLMFGTMLSAALAVGVGAQQPPASTGASPQTPSSSAPPMTVTGCLQAASDAAGGAGAAGAAATAAPGAQARGGFILTNVTPAGSMAGGATAPGGSTSSATGTSGTAKGGAATGGAAARSTYRLIGGENLQQHVGQKVEVTGTVAAGAGSSSSSAAPGAAAAPGAPAGSPAGAGASASSSSPDGQALRVTSVRPTGEKCS
jgi:hypothetical protein